MVTIDHVHDTLPQRWNTLWERLDARGNPVAVFIQLDLLYAHLNRRYHTFTHVAHCFIELHDAVVAAEQEATRAEKHAHVRSDGAMQTAENDAQRAAAKQRCDDEVAQANRLRFTEHERNVIEAAIWFHDAVIIRGCACNEVLSVALMQHVFHEAGMRPNVIGDIAHCIRRSTHRDPPTRDRMVGTFLDVDLSILGQSQFAYDAYASRIRCEYGDVPNAQFAAGRIGVLRPFLAREHIYGTDFFAERYEQHARENLQREITSLERGAL